MYLGEYSISVTSGNRVAIPKRLRGQLNKSGGTNGGLVVTRGYEGCIVLVAESEFHELLNGVSDIPFISANKRETARFLLSGAHEVELDAQGRFIIPESLHQYAKITDGKVVFLGVGNWIEIWDEAVWQEYRARLDDNSSEIAERLLQTQSTKQA